jgi:hypothetical protein
VAEVANINDLLDGHVGLTVDCVDRLYLNGYCPILQVGGQVVRFLTEHLGNPIPSPALFEKIGNRFRREVDHFAAGHDIPLLHLKKPDRTRWDDRKLDHIRPHLDRAAAHGRFGVVAIVVAQEVQWVTGARNRCPAPGVVSYEFVREQRRVNAYYFYILDPAFGPGFIKICSYFPYPVKVYPLTELRRGTAWLGGRLEGRGFTVPARDRFRRGARSGGVGGARGGSVAGDGFPV